MRQIILASLKMFFLMTLLLGFMYPLVVTGIGHLFFREQAAGSLITVDGKKVGSSLIGQLFDTPHYFWGRPSATPDVPYNAKASSGSNFGPTNPQLLSLIKKRISLLSKDNPNQPIPIDLVTASASGLDPHISPAAAFYQIPRVAQARKISESVLRQRVEQQIESRQWGILGEPRVNVLKLNLILDKDFPILNEHGTKKTQSR